MYRSESYPIWVIQNKSDASYTTNAIDLGNYRHLRVLSYSSDGFNGQITVIGLMSGEDNEANMVDSGSNYVQFGAAHTLNTCQYYLHCPRKVKISYTGRTTGTLNLWIQPFND